MWGERGSSTGQGKGGQSDTLATHLPGFLGIPHRFLLVYAMVVAVVFLVSVVRVVAKQEGLRPFVPRSGSI